MNKVIVEHNNKVIRECTNRQQALVYVQAKIGDNPFSSTTTANNVTYVKLLGCDDVYKIRNSEGSKNGYVPTKARSR